MITVQLITGIAFAVLLADKLGRIRLQIIGFFGCALGLLIASLSVDFPGSLKILLIFAGFMLFDFMTNLGPNAQTCSPGRSFRPRSAGRVPVSPQPLPRSGRSQPRFYFQYFCPRLARGLSFAGLSSLHCSGCGDLVLPHRDRGSESRPYRGFREQGRGRQCNHLSGGRFGVGPD